MSRTFSTPIYVPESPKSQRAAETDEPAEVKDTAVRAFMVSKGLLLCCLIKLIVAVSSSSIFVDDDVTGKEVKIVEEHSGNGSRPRLC